MAGWRPTWIRWSHDPEFIQKLIRHIVAQTARAHEPSVLMITQGA